MKGVDDLAVDTKFIGKEYPPFVYEVGREKIKEFAKAIGETNPLYLDEEAAKKGPHGDIVAPPTFASLYAGGPVGEMLYDKELALNLMMLVHGEQDFEFFEVARAGDTMTTKCRISEISEKSGKSFVTAETMTTNQNGRPVVKARWTFVIRG